MRARLQHFARMGIEGEQYALRPFVLISNAGQATSMNRWP